MKITENKQLRGLFSLDHNIKLYIPSTVNVDRKIDNSQHVTNTLALFSRLFGGATSYKAKGAWNSDAKGLVVESITIVESYGTADQMNDGLETVLKYASGLKATMNQEAISLEYDNRLYFV